MRPSSLQPAPRPRRFSFWRLLRANLFDLLLLVRESWFALLLFGVLAVAGTLYFHITAPERFGYGAALYETLRLLTLQSGEPLPTDLLGQALFFLIPILGLMLIVQSVLTFGRLVIDKTSRRAAWQIALAATYDGHIVVAGLGRVGLRVMTQLTAAGYDVVIIERTWDSAFVLRALALKVPVIVGDARDVATLQQAGVLRAHALVAAVSDDLVNIEIAITARLLRPHIRTVLRVFNDDLEASLERAFGRNAVYSTTALAAPTFAAAAVSREVEYVLPVGDQLLGVARFGIVAGSALAGNSHAIEEQHGMRVVQHQRGDGTVLAPSVTRRIEANDELLVLGSLATLEAMRAANVVNRTRTPPVQSRTAQFNHVIMCGLGRASYRTVLQLMGMRPAPRVVIIHQSDENPAFLQDLAQFPQVERMVGDARDLGMLRQAGLDTAYSVVALTADDGLNIQIALTARRHRADVHVVVRVFSDVLADRLADLFGIRTTYSTSGLAGPTLSAAAVLGDVSDAFFAEGQLYATDIYHIPNGNRWIGQTIAAFQERFHVIVLGLERDAVLHALPPLDSSVLPGDRIRVLGTMQAIRRVRAAERA